MRLVIGVVMLESVEWCLPGGVSFLAEAVETVGSGDEAAEGGVFLC